MTNNQPKIEMSDLVERIADVLLALAGVGVGDFGIRLHKDLDGDQPMMLLYDGINEMIESLGTEQERNGSYQKQLEEKLVMIEAQRAAIRELSTPIIEVWDGVLCSPIVGIMDTIRSAEMSETLLDAIVEKETHCVILDITGIQIMDTGTADHFLKMARAVRLLGAECVLTGINPSIALTMQEMGVDLSDIVTLRSLRDALQRYLDSAQNQTRMRNQKIQGARRIASMS